MLKREELEKQLKDKLLSAREWYLSRSTDSSISAVGKMYAKEKVAKIDHILENFQEYVRQFVANAARNVVRVAANKKKLGYYEVSYLLSINKFDSSCINSLDMLDSVNRLGIEQGNPILEPISSASDDLYGTPEAEEVIQKVYESFGYTDKLITVQDLRESETELNSINRHTDMQRYFDLMAKIKIARNHAGMYLDGFNFWTDEEVNEIVAVEYRDEIDIKKYREEAETSKSR